MRIWDIDPGYLNRQSLLGEHRELHGMASILVNGKKGYARQPETLRWAPHLDALYQRHRQLAAEMHLRGYHDRSPLPSPPPNFTWPPDFIDPPAEQSAAQGNQMPVNDEGRTLPVAVDGAGGVGGMGVALTIGLSFHEGDVMAVHPPTRPDESQGSAASVRRRLLQRGCRSRFLRKASALFHQPGGRYFAPCRVPRRSSSSSMAFNISHLFIDHKGASRISRGPSPVRR